MVWVSIPDQGHSVIKDMQTCEKITDSERCKNLSMELYWGQSEGQKLNGDQL